MSEKQDLEGHGEGVVLTKDTKHTEKSLIHSVS